MAIDAGFAGPAGTDSTHQRAYCEITQNETHSLPEESPWRRAGGSYRCTDGAGGRLRGPARDTYRSDACLSLRDAQGPPSHTRITHFSVGAACTFIVTVPLNPVLPLPIPPPLPPKHCPATVSPAKAGS